MVRKTIVLSAFLAGIWASGAQAAVELTEDRTRIVDGGKEGHIVIAQSGDVEIYFDGNGNRVLVDSYTGEVIAVQPPRRALRQREFQRQDDYYLDELENMRRPRRERDYRSERYPEPPIEDYRDYSRGLPTDEFPPAPGRAFPEDERYPDSGFEPEPQVVTRQPVERAPLDGVIVQPPAEAQPSDQITVPRATIEPPTTFAAREEVAALQVLLDRAGASPGVIDGRFGSNVDKALVAYRELTGVNLKSTDTAMIQEALAASGGEPFTTYTISPEDAAGPFVAAIPSDYGEKAQLGHLSYTSVAEMLAERFHMDETYLKSLNPGVNFSRPGTQIRVANVGRSTSTKVQRIIADKGRKQVRAYDEAGKLVAAYPATIGSADTPSPTGTHLVSRVALNPNYTYNPKLNFKQGNNDRILTIPPGPNGPVGSVWIALDKPTYGIHGTPDPSKIGKTESHGCVRLTNWDAEELAKLVSPGVSVEFVE